MLKCCKASFADMGYKADMANITELTRIALADASATEARQIIQGLLKADASPDSYGKIATALRAWIWKTLTSRRHDGELADWHDMLRRLARRASDFDQGMAARFQILSELIHESIVSPDIADPKSVLQRSHVRKALEHLAVADDGRMERSDLGSALSLQQANLTRIINMMVASGLVIKTSEGRRVIVELTHAGKQEARALGTSAQMVVVSAATEELVLRVDRLEAAIAKPREPGVMRGRGRAAGYIAVADFKIYKSPDHFAGEKTSYNEHLCLRRDEAAEFTGAPSGPVITIGMGKVGSV